MMPGNTQQPDTSIVVASGASSEEPSAAILLPSSSRSPTKGSEATGQMCPFYSRIMASPPSAAVAAGIYILYYCSR